MSQEPTADMIRAVPLFHGLPEALLARLALQFRIRDYPSGHTLFFEGDDGASLYVVLTGCLSVQRTTGSGATLHIADRGPGEHVGELSLLDNEPRSADVVALEACRVLVLNRRDFERAVQQSPELGLSLLQSLARRLREQSTRLSKQSSLDTLGRLCLVLLELGADGKIKLTQRALADRIGAQRETVNRALAQLVQVGAISSAPSGIQVLDRAYLEERSQPL